MLTLRLATWLRAPDFQLMLEEEGQEMDAHWACSSSQENSSLDRLNL